MICPKCGYMVTKRQGACPKCKTPLSDDTAEWSTDSGSMEATADLEAKPAPTPPPEAPGDYEDPGSGPKPVAASEPDPKPDSEREVKISKGKGKRKDGDKPTMGEPIPPAEESGGDSSGVGPLFTSSRKSRQTASKSSSGKMTDPRISYYEYSEQPDKVKYTEPEPYMKDSATFSSELSTDWIERYSRSHVRPLPERAGFGVRFWGGLLDWMFLISLLVIALLLGKLFFSVLNDVRYTPQQLLRILAWPIGGFWFVIVVVYHTFFVSLSGQTPGYSIMDLRVVDAESHHPPSVGKAFIRSMIYIGGVLALGAGCWLAFIDPSRSTLHDKLSSTKTVPVIKL